MERLYQKRTNILDLVDRLHIKKAIVDSSEEKEGLEERTIKEHVNPLLFENPKNKLIKVEPGTNGKVKRRVFMLRRSRTTEGGSLVCEICGHLSFKLFSTAIEIAEECKRPSQWRRTQTEIVKICRTCFVEHKGRQTEQNKTGKKAKVRPEFERSPFGITTGRASNSWHFLRRDVVKSKEKMMTNKECFEEEFQNEFLSEEESTGRDTPQSSDEDETSYEDSGSEEYSLLPFQYKGRKALISSCALELVDIKNEDLLNNESPITTPKEELTELLLSEEELVIDKSETNTHNNDMKKTTTENGVSDGNLMQMLLKDIKSTIDVVKDESMCMYINQYDDVFSDGELFDYFAKYPARFRKLKVIRRKRMKSQTKSPERKVNLQPNKYTGVCRLVTVINQRKGKFIDNSESTCLYDHNGMVWRKKDLPSFVGINTKRNKDARPTYRQRKKDIDAFMTETKPKYLVKYKKPSLVKEANVQIVPITSVTLGNGQSKENKSGISGESLEEEEDEQEEKKGEEECDEHAENEPEFEENGKIIEEKQSNKASNDHTKNTVQRKEKETHKDPRSNPANTQRSCPYDCAVCETNLYRKSYNLMRKGSCPLIYEKLFGGQASIRVCKSCLRKKTMVSKIEPPISKSRKRGRQDDDKETSPITAKSLKSSNTVAVKSKTNVVKVETKISPNKSNQKKGTKQSPIQSKQKVSPISKEKQTPSTSRKEMTRVVDKTQADKFPAKTQEENNTFKGTAKPNNAKVGVNMDRKPDLNQLSKVTSDQKTKYVLLKSGGSLQTLSTVVKDSPKQEVSDITINGKTYKVDTEFKLNELLKENENASQSADSNKDILSHLPNILKNNMNKKTFSTSNKIHQISPTQDKTKHIVAKTTVIQGNKPYKVIPTVKHNGTSKSIDAVNQPKSKNIHSVANSSLPSISLQIQEQLRTTKAAKLNTTTSKVLQSQLTASQATATITTPGAGPVKSIKMITPPKSTSPMKRPMLGSPLNTPMPPKI